MQNERPNNGEPVLTGFLQRELRIHHRGAPDLKLCRISREFDSNMDGDGSFFLSPHDNPPQPTPQQKERRRSSMLGQMAGSLFGGSSSQQSSGVSLPKRRKRSKKKSTDERNRMPSVDENNEEKFNTPAPTRYSFTDDRPEIEQKFRIEESTSKFKSSVEKNLRCFTVKGPKETEYGIILPADSTSLNVKEHYENSKGDDKDEVTFQTFQADGGGRRYKLTIGELKGIVKQRKLDGHLEATICVAALNGVPDLKKAVNDGPNSTTTYLPTKEGPRT